MMKPVTVTLSDLKPAPYNPRSITPEAVAGLKTSLVQFGDIAGFTWNRRTGHMVAGHQRLASLKALHGDKLTVVCEGEDRGEIQTPDGQRFPLRIVDWDENREKAANVAANNPHVAGDFDLDKLGITLDDIKEWDSALFDDLRMEVLFRENGDVFDAAPTGAPGLPSGDREPFQQMTFTLSDDQAETVKEALDRAKKSGPFVGPNQNSNGNSLARLAEVYLGEG